MLPIPAPNFALQVHGQDEWREPMLFASIFIPNFSLQSHFAKRPELQAKSIALIDGTPPLLRVVAANDKALKAGVEIGLLKAQAEAVGAEAILRSADLEDSVHSARSEERRVGKECR